MLEIVPRRRPGPGPRPHPSLRHRPARRFYGGGYGPYPVYAPMVLDVEEVSPATTTAWRVLVDRGRDRMFYGATAQAALDAVPKGAKALQLQRYTGSAWVAVLAMGIESYEEEDLSGFPLWLLPLALTPLLLRKTAPATSLVVEPVLPTPPVPTVAPTPLPGQPSLFMEPERVPVSAPPIAPIPPPKTIAVAKAQKKVTIDTAKLIREHEASVKKRLAVEAKKLAKAGVSQKTIEREVQAVLKKLPSAQLSKAATELKKTGKVSTTTKKAIQDASKAYQNAHPELKQAVNKAAKPLRDAQKAIPQDLKREVDNFTKSLPPQLKGAGDALLKGLKNGRLDPNAMAQLGVQKTKEQLEKFGKDYGSKTLTNIANSSGLKIPGGMDVGGTVNAISDVLKDPTAEGAAQAGYTAGKGFLENRLQETTGIPITLPAGLSPKELEKWVGGLVPGNAREALELSLSIGTQAAASAVSTLLAGTAIGSVIPGLGTLVGIGAALGVAALRNALKEPPPPYARKCSSAFIEKRYEYNKGGVKIVKKVAECPKLPTVKNAKGEMVVKLSPMELIPWISTTVAPIYKAIAEEKQRKYCGAGEIVACSQFLSTMMQKAEQLSTGTPEVLGLQETERLIKLYEAAPKTFLWFSERGAISALTGPADNKIHPIEFQELKRILTALKRRRSYLQEMVRKAEATLSRIPVLMSTSVSLVDNAIRPVQDELKFALMQYQFSNKSKAAEQWLAAVLTLLQKAAVKRAAILNESQKYFDKKYEKRVKEARAKGVDPWKDVVVT